MRFFNDSKRYRAYVYRSARSILKAEVAGSHLNWIWWILDPLCFMLIYAFIFGLVFNGVEKYFAAFIFIGLTGWNFFNQCVLNSVRAVRQNKQLIDKVYLPKYVLLYTRMGVDGFKMMISFGIVALMVAVYRIHLTWHIFLVIPLLFLLMVITFACMTILMHLGVFIEDMRNIINIVLRLVFYITGIFYNVEKRLPAPYGVWVMRINPLAYILDGLRSCILYGRAPGWELYFIWLGIGLLVSVIGVAIIYRYENGYAKVV